MLKAIAVMGTMKELDDPEMEAELMNSGFSKREAALLVAFVPQAFARPVLEKLGVTQFSESVSAKNHDDEMVSFPLASMPKTTAGRMDAAAHLDRGRQGSRQIPGDRRVGSLPAQIQKAQNLKTSFRESRLRPIGLESLGFRQT
jgi:hypothetical protein